MKKDKHISIVLETETYNKLAAYAQEDYRRVGNLARHIIKLYIKAVDSGAIHLSVYNHNDKWDKNMS